METDDASGPKPSDFDDPNDFYLDHLFRTVQRLTEAGIDEREALIEATNAVMQACTNLGPEHATVVEDQGTTFLTEATEYRQGFAERLRVHWGPALDLYELIAEYVEYGGRQFAKRNLGRAGERDLLLDVLVS